MWYGDNGMSAIINLLRQGVNDSLTTAEKTILPKIKTYHGWFAYFICKPLKVIIWHCIPGQRQKAMI